MAKRANNSPIPEPFVRLTWEVLRSKAYKSLPPLARALLVELYLRFNGSNNGNIVLGEREACMACNVRKRETIRRAFAELEDRGFIRRTFIGSFSQKSKVASEWLLTQYADMRVGASAEERIPTKDWKAWRPPEKTELGAPERSRAGHQNGPVNNSQDTKTAPTGHQSGPEETHERGLTGHQNGPHLESAMGVPSLDADRRAAQSGKKWHSGHGDGAALDAVVMRLPDSIRHEAAATLRSMRHDARRRLIDEVVAQPTLEAQRRVLASASQSQFSASTVAEGPA